MYQTRYFKKNERVDCRKMVKAYQLTDTGSFVSQCVVLCSPSTSSSNTTIGYCCPKATAVAKGSIIC